jgi:hypothetical protein
MTFLIKKQSFKQLTVILRVTGKLLLKKNLILRRDYVPKVVNYMTEVIEQMGIPEDIDDFKAHYTFWKNVFLKDIYCGQVEKK